jgi:hypothetical protein
MVKSIASHHKIGENDVMRFVSGTTVLEEAVKGGCYMGLYWSASNQVHRENITGMLLGGTDPMLCPAASFGLEIDGQSLHDKWIVEKNTQKTEDSGHIVWVTTLKHSLRPVEVNVFTRLDNTSYITRWLEITNTGDKPSALSKVSPFCGILWKNDFSSLNYMETTLSKHKNCEEPFSVAYMDAYSASEESNLKWVDISLPEYVFANHFRQTFGAPYYMAKNNISGESFIIALAWSGGLETKIA